VERAEAEAIYDAGREVVVEVLLRMDRQIQQLTARVDRLERELRKNSRNSSWGAFTARHAVLEIRADRNEDHARELLADTSAIVTSDRWWAYTHLPVARRQVCWAHYPGAGIIWSWLRRPWFSGVSGSVCSA
jgi:hypothetical protein